jgi:hypothetical protein
MIEPEDYKVMIDKYYLIGYKWKDNLEKMVSIPNKRFMKFTNANVRTLETIDISVAYPYFKIVNLNFYLLPPSNIDNNLDNIIDNIIDNNNIDHNQVMLNYINNEASKDKITKISIKIVENDKIFTVMDDNFNIYKINDTIQINNTKNIKIKMLISNFIEKSYK